MSTHTPKDTLLLELSDLAIRVTQEGYPVLGSALAHLGACAAFNLEHQAHAQLKLLSERVASLYKERQQGSS